MRYFFALILALLACTAHAQTPAACWPSDIAGQGSKAARTINMQGQAVGWWCPDGSSSVYAVQWSDMTDQIGAAINAAWDAPDRQAAAAALVQLVTKTRADTFAAWAPIAAWKPFATEGQSITVTRPAVVRYGVDTRWVRQIVPVTGGMCTNAWFGRDPAPNVSKGCEEAVLIGGPPPLQPPIYTHRVKALTGATDRPVYPFLAGARVTTAIVGVRATLGVGCKPEVAMAPSGASTTDLYAAYAPAFAASQVTLCTKATP